MPIENSLTPIGADSDAKQRSIVLKDTNMPDEKKETTAPAEKPPENAAPPAAEKPEIKPATPAVSIREAFEAITPKGYEGVMERAIIEGKDLEGLRVDLREEHAKRSKPVGTPEAKPEDKKQDITVEEFHRAFAF